MRLLALWHPSRYLKKNDTPEEYKRHLRLMYVMIVVSAILFGLDMYYLALDGAPAKLQAPRAGVALAGLDLHLWATFCCIVALVDRLFLICV